MGFNYGNLAFEKLQSTINVDIQFSFRNLHYKTVSVPLGTHRLDDNGMTITCHKAGTKVGPDQVGPPVRAGSDQLGSTRIVSDHEKNLTLA